MPSVPRREALAVDMPERATTVMIKEEGDNDERRKRRRKQRAADVRRMMK